MKEHPILFSGEMVQAILDGRKTQTRRVIKPQPYKGDFLLAWPFPQGRAMFADGVGEPSPEIHCPYGHFGDRLWVREAFNWSSDDLLLPDENYRKCPERKGWSADNVIWKADGDRTHPKFGKAIWKPSIHMPRWASRITLEIVNVRVERVQEIDNNGALWEGTPDLRTIENEWDLRDCFQELWNSLNAKRGYGWEVNPWVWVIEFKKLEPAQ